MAKVAIVGVGCRFPGADNIDEFWQVLKNGENHVVEIPENRWNIDAFYDADPGAPGKTYVRRAGFINGHDKWDFKAFGINEIESLRMDPQHKYVLDCTLMALENAGITRKSVKGSNTGVYIGVMNNDYSSYFTGSLEEFDNYTLTGTSNSIVSSRISYVFDLRGPSLAIDTACSSSLIAIHNAHQAILAGECDMAIAGGVNALLDPDIFIQLSKAGMVSPTGQCQAFSENADGYARGEGCGIVILKSYDQAVKDNDPIWATIYTASNHDGRSVAPITTPSKEQQMRLLETVFTRFQIDPQTVDYIEAHGTGTKAGDPVEVGALGAFFQREKNCTEKYIGSVKTNIGHLESAAGIAGLIKVLLCHKHQMIVPTLHFDKPSKEVPLEKYKLKVPTKRLPWPGNNREFMRSSVNSFSFGGSNGHTIVTSLKAGPVTRHTEKDVTPKIVCLSAMDRASLQKMKESTCEKAKDANLADFSYTSTIRRDHCPYRIAVHGHSTQDILQSLNSNDVDDHIANLNPDQEKKIIFVFAGLGSNWEGMCRYLLTRFDVFRNTIKKISQLLTQHVSWDLHKKMQNGFDLNDPFISPIMTFACEVGLFELLQSFGIHPDVVLGQSIGEVAASYASGALSLQQAVHIIFHRTRVQARGTGGKMFVAKNMDITKVTEVLNRTKYVSRANIAVFSSSSSCTLSCDADIQRELKEDLIQISNQAVFIDLNVTSAFHSHHMDKCSKEMKACSGIHGQLPTTQIISTVSGKAADPGDFVTSQYWADNIRKPVKLFQAVVEAADQTMRNLFVEIGPRPILRSHLPNIFGDSTSYDALSTMNVKNELDCITKAVGELYQHGCDIQWTSFLNLKANVVDFPNYQFNRVPNLFQTDNTKEKLMGIDTSSKHHPFVKPSQSKTSAINILIDTRRLGSLYEHRVNGLSMAPGALYAEVGLAISALKSSTVAFHEVTVKFKKTLLLDNRRPRRLQTLMEDKDEYTEFIVSEGDNIYCTGRLSKRFNKSAPVLNLNDIRKRCGVTLDSNQIYANLNVLGFSYGKAMSILDEAVTNNKEALTKVTLNEALKREIGGTVLHPAIIDSMLQTPPILGNTVDKQILPVEIEKLRVYNNVEDTMYIYTIISPATTSSLVRYKLILCATSGTPIASIELFTIKVIGQNDEIPHNLFFEEHWKLVLALPKKFKNQSKFMYVASNAHDYTGNGCVSVIPLANNNSKLDEFKRNLKDHNNVAIFINLDNNHTDYSVSDIQTLVTDYLLWLKVVLEALNDAEDISNIAICCNNVWRFDQEPRSLISNFKQSLWGSVRSIQRELLVLKLHLLDLHIIHGQDQHDVLCFLFDELSASLQHQGELLIDKQGIFGYEFNNIDGDDLKNYPVLRNRSDADFELYSDTETQQNPFRIFPLRSLPEKRPGLVTLNISTLVFHDSELLVPVLDSSLEKSDIGSRVFCLETIGFQGQNVHQPLVSCFLVPASNRVIVPLSCCLPRNSFPSYQPGKLSTLVALWSLVSRVETSEVVILISAKPSVYGNLLFLMLKARNIKSRIVTQQEVEASKYIDAPEIVCLTDVDKLLCKMILSSSSVRFLICFSCFLPSDVAALLRTSLRQINIHRINEIDIFSIHHISSAVKGITSWFKKDGKSIKNILDQPESLSSHDTVHKLFSVRHVDVQSGNGLEMFHLRLVPGRMLSTAGAYIVTGGLTGLGWECVQWLAHNNAGVVICINRRKPSQFDSQRIKALATASSCILICLSSDVTNLTSLQNSLDKFQGSFPNIPVKGVIHGAGVLKDVSLFRTTKDQITNVLNPKIQGSWNMHLLTLNMKLDFFIMQSSQTSVLGSPGQSSYGAGNAFQDSLVATRRLMGLPAQSINWGPLDMGMLEEAKDNNRTRQIFADLGYNLISKETIKMCMETVLLSNKPHLLVADFDVQKLQHGITASSDYFTFTRLKPILPKPVFQRSNSIISNAGEIGFQILEDVDPEQKSVLIESYVSKLVSKVLSVGGSSLSQTTSLLDAGMDSMLAMALVNQVKNDIGFKVPPNLLFTPDTSISTLSRYIEEEYTGSEIPVYAVPASRPTVPAASSDGAISFPEHEFLQIYNDNTIYKHVHLPTVIHLDNVDITSEMVQSVIKNALEQHPITRTVYNWKDGMLSHRANVTKSELSLNESADICEVKEHLENLENIYFERTWNKFDVTSKGPIRFTFTVLKNGLRLAIVFNHVAFDFIGVSLFIQNLVASMNSMRERETTSKPMLSVKGQRDTTTVLQNLAEQEKEKLVNYWKEVVQNGVPRMCLGFNKTFHHSQYPAQVAVKTLSPKTNATFDQYVRSHGTTSTKLYISIYQLLLSFRSKSKRVFVTVPVNMRPYSTELQNRIECITNLVPVFTDIASPEAKFADFVKTNSNVISSALAHATLPYSDIVGLIPKIDHKTLFKHVINFNDNTFVSEISEHTKTLGINLKIDHGNPYTALEAALQVFTDRVSKDTTLKLLLGGDSATQADTEDFLREFVMIVEAVITRQNITIQELQDLLLPSLSGTFKKETWKGMVSVEVKFEKFNNQLNVTIDDKVILGSDMKEVYTTGDDEVRALVIKTKKKQYRLLYNNSDKNILKLLEYIQSLEY